MNATVLGVLSALAASFLLTASYQNMLYLHFKKSLYIHQRNKRLNTALLSEPIVEGQRKKSGYLSPLIFDQKLRSEQKPK